ncbi:restriction endonuclease [Streptomyces sp. ODS28]|uniref:restriction endonuclease n=1 Tax=Streptomyces sp. ODS28 TaxID=3136688 RepID=UPI0031E7C7A4
MNETVLLESRSLRSTMAERHDVLDKVKALTLLPDGVHVTTRMVATYFEVDIEAIKSLVKDHRSEVESNGYRLLSADELRAFKELSSLDKHAGRHVAVFTRRTVLNVALLLRDSVVARQVRSHLLDTEARSRTEEGPAAPHSPVDNSADAPAAPSTGTVAHDLLAWLSQEIQRTVADHLDRTAAATELDAARVREIAEATVREVLGTAVLPLLNEAVRRDTELHLRVTDHHEEITRLNRVLWEREAAGSLASLDAMDGRQFAEHIAWLCRRDGCTGVTVSGGAVLGFTADGRRLVVHCKHRAPAATITSSDVQTFHDAARMEQRTDAALLVSTAPFNRDALLLASHHDITAVHRGLLESWNNGARLQALA